MRESTTAISKDSNFEDDRQREIAIGPPIPEVLISEKQDKRVILQCDVHVT